MRAGGQIAADQQLIHSLISMTRMFQDKFTIGKLIRGTGEVHHDTHNSTEGNLMRKVRHGSVSSDFG
jgi:hypothetical protein